MILAPYMCQEITGYVHPEVFSRSSHRSSSPSVPSRHRCPSISSQRRIFTQISSSSSSSSMSSCRILFNKRLRLYGNSRPLAWTRVSCLLASCQETRRNCRKFRHYTVEIVRENKDQLTRRQRKFWQIARS